MTTMTEEQTTTSPGAAFTNVMTSAFEFAAAKASQKAGGWTDKLNDVAAEDGGAKQQAGAKGVRAGLEGKNPVWAAIKGAWSGGSSKVRAAIVAAVVALVLMLVLSPVLLLVFLLALLIIAAATKARSAQQ